MKIQWFPGHMTKALRMMQDSVKTVDAVGYVLDARAPGACFNPSFESVVGNKPCVFILNKCDLADISKLDKWCAYFEQAGAPYVKVTATASAQASKISAAFAAITANLRAKNAQKGIFKPVRCIIIGVPNCGKSTIINCLSGKKAVITGDKPGVTKGKQWVRLQSGLELLDTPGTLWPKFDDDIVAARLCFIGSIKDEVVDLYELALELIAQLRQLYPKCISERYNIECLPSETSEDIFNAIAKRRGFIMRGGEIDTGRCSKAILDDFRKGKLGKITFDLPSQQ